VLAAAYARGAWPLGFVLLVPWTLATEQLRGARANAVAAAAMAAAFGVAVLGWFAPAIAGYTGVPTALALAVLLIASPLLQPQLLAFALVRHGARRFGPVLRATLAIAAWLATEWALPRLFGDSLGQGLQPSRLLRQGADVAGVGGLTLALLAANEALVHAIAQRRARRAVAWPLLVAAAMPLLLAGYGAVRLATLSADPVAPPLRIALVQADITDYERLRRERGAYAVVRTVLDTHYALSREALARGADALVWPETVYPTTFGRPKSAAGADLDRELVDFAQRGGVPLVFGTYDRDDGGEYNSAAFIDPQRGPLGAYRKTRLFPLTEYVPPALDGPALRRLLPWAGTWRPGDGARVFPLLLRDGREVPVAPLICRDDLDPALARQAASLGAQLLVGLSNDAWFTAAPLGARLHLQAAAMRSVETRLPQVRATTNGLSAVVDATGEIVQHTRMGERTVLLADVRPRDAVRSPQMRAGDLLGPLSAGVLLAWACIAARARWWRRRDGGPDEPGDAAKCARRVLVVRPWQRWTIGGLRLVARIAVLVLGLLAITADDAPGMLAQLRLFAAWVVLPEALAGVLALACAATLCVDGDRLVLAGRHRTVEFDLRRIAELRAWRVPWPRPGFDIHLASTRRWTHGIAARGTGGLLRALDIDTTNAPSSRVSRGMQRMDAFDIAPRPIDRVAAKFVLFPLLPALPAFRLHQLIAYGSAFGEFYTFGARAYLGALLLWWASWAVALVLVAGGLRAVAEFGAAAVMLARPRHAKAARGGLLAAARLAYFVGIPAWLAVRLLAT
jgi:apolipoprotein N-acyltransferase